MPQPQSELENASDRNIKYESLAVELIERTELKLNKLFNLENSLRVAIKQISKSTGFQELVLVSKKWIEWTKDILNGNELTKIEKMLQDYNEQINKAQIEIQQNPHPNLTPIQIKIKDYLQKINVFRKENEIVLTPPIQVEQEHKELNERNIILSKSLFLEDLEKTHKLAESKKIRQPKEDKSITPLSVPSLQEQSIVTRFLAWIKKISIPLSRKKEDTSKSSANILQRFLLAPRVGDIMVSKEIKKSIEENIELLHQSLVDLIRMTALMPESSHFFPGKVTARIQQLNAQTKIENLTNRINTIIERLNSFTKILPSAETQYRRKIQLAVADAQAKLKPPIKPNTITGEQQRLQATMEGLPPVMALATQLSTRRLSNLVQFRGSGPIPAGLFHDIPTGISRPKPVIEKAKSSTIGPQAGRATKDFKNGRYDRNKITGKYELRSTEKPKEGVEEHVLEVSLRNIFNEIGTRYKLLNEKPDKDGMLHFIQINLESPDIKAIQYSISINQAKPIPKEIKESYLLFSNYLEHQGKKPLDTSPFYGRDLDAMSPVYVKHPLETSPQPLMVLGSIVRDVDVDYMSPPDALTMNEIFGLSEKIGKKYLKPIEMTAHFHFDPKSELNEEEQESLEKLRANKAKVQMVSMLLELNQLSWDKYDTLKLAAQTTLGREFSSYELSQWEEDHATLRPFIPKNMDFAAMTAAVVTIGNGTAMELYQGLEINFIEQKITASCTAPLGTRVAIKDLDNPLTRNAALMKIHNQDIIYSQARAFIQHPNESNNNIHYIGPRSYNVAVIGDIIQIVNDEKSAKLAAKNNQYVPINPLWIADNSPGNTNAKIWAKHFLSLSDSHYSLNPSNAHYNENIELANTVNRFLVGADNKIMLQEFKDEFIKKPYLKSTQESLAYLRQLEEKVDKDQRLSS